MDHADYPSLPAAPVNLPCARHAPPARPAGIAQRTVSGMLARLLHDRNRCILATLKPAYAALLLGNIVTTVLALWHGWPIGALLLPFCLQSMLLGMFHVHRILRLQSFSTEGFTSNGRRVPETVAGKRSTAAFFALHYGFFHLFYLGFALFATARSGPGGLTPFWLWVLMGTLLLTQYLNHRDNLSRDAGGRPNLGGMMFLPYLRIIPMHLIVFIGSAAGDGPTTLLAFMGLKTLADLGMQAAEVALQRTSQRSRTY